MKKTSSFNLEEMTYNDIIRYKEENNLSSRNIALEMMLMERRSMLKMLNHIPKVCCDPVESNIIDSHIEESKNEDNDFISNSLEDSFLSMPD